MLRLGPAGTAIEPSIAVGPTVSACGPIGEIPGPEMVASAVVTPQTSPSSPIFMETISVAPDGAAGSHPTLNTAITPATTAHNALLIRFSVRRRQDAKTRTVEL